jgi:hypothetical protein
LKLQVRARPTIEFDLDSVEDNGDASDAREVAEKAITKLPDFFSNFRQLG